MSSKATRDAMRAARLDVRAENDMNDPIVQEGILNPKPTKIQVSFATLELFPLSAKKQRHFHGLATTILGAAVSSRNANGSDTSDTITSIFLTGVLSRSEHLTADLLYFVAAATELPGQLDETQIKALVAEFDEKATTIDLVTLFGILSKLTGFTESIGGMAKNGAAPQAIHP